MSACQGTGFPLCVCPVLSSIPVFGHVGIGAGKDRMQAPLPPLARAAASDGCRHGSRIRGAQLQKDEAAAEESSSRRSRSRRLSGASRRLVLSNGEDLKVQHRTYKQAIHLFFLAEGREKLENSPLPSQVSTKVLNGAQCNSSVGR